MSEAVDRLVAVMKKLRDPDGGCPWDLEQTFRSIAPDTLEEAYEVIEAIEQDDMPHLKEELGDLLLEIVFHAQMGAEKNLFSLDEIAAAEADKMIERHPHVFGDRSGVHTGADVIKNWEADKAAKREAQAASEQRAPSALDGINTALPALSRALKIQKRAVRVGFDWRNVQGVVAKLYEEIAELEVELAAHETAPNLDRIEDELGDVLFVVVNIARFMKLDPEQVLRRSNRKFERRFRAMEEHVAALGRSVETSTPEQREDAWQAVKRAEKAA